MRWSGTIGPGWATTTPLRPSNLTLAQLTVEDLAKEAAAAIWAGEQVEKLDLENCAIVLLIRPQIVVLQERERRAF